MTEALVVPAPKEAAFHQASHETVTYDKFGPITRSQLKDRTIFHQGPLKQGHIAKIKGAEYWSKHPLLANNLNMNGKSVQETIKTLGEQHAKHLRNFEKPGVLDTHPLFGLIEQKALEALFREAASNAVDTNESDATSESNSAAANVAVENREAIEDEKQNTPKAQIKTISRHLSPAS